MIVEREGVVLAQSISEALERRAANLLDQATLAANGVMVVLDRAKNVAVFAIGIGPA